MARPLDHQIGESIPEDRWRIVEVTETHVVSEADIGDGMRMRRRQLIGDDELQKINAHLFDTSGRFSQRSAGAVGTPVANIPLSVLYDPRREIISHIRRGDREHLRYFLNSEDARPFRTHKGKL